MENEETQPRLSLRERLGQLLLIKPPPLDLPKRTDDEDSPFPLKPGRTIKGL